MKLLLFSEFIASNKFFFFVIEKLHIINPFVGMGTYTQGVPIQNAADFIWGTESGIRTLPVSLFFTILSWLTGSHWSSVYLIFSIFLPFALFIGALRLYKKIDLFVIIGAIFYSWNTWIIDRLASGFWQLNIAYAFLPFFIIVPMVLSKRIYVSKNNLFFWASIYSLLASIVILGQPHFLVMISLFLCLHLLKIFLSKNYDAGRRLLTFYFISGILFCFINIYLFVPSILFPEYNFTAPNQYFSLGSVLFNGTGANLFHILQMSPLDFPFKEIPLSYIEWFKFLQLGMVGFFWILKKKKEWLLTLCLLCFIFMAKGLHQPFSQMSIFLYTYIPVLHFFRDPERFLGAVSLFGALIIAFTDRKIHLKLLSKISIAICVLVIFLLSNWNIISNKLPPVLTKTLIPNQYIAMQKYINSIHSHGRLMILPNINSYSGYSFFHDTLLPSSTLYDMALPLSVPLADSTNYPDTYANQVSALVYSKFTEKYNSKLLTMLGDKYILTDDSITSPSSEKDIATTSAYILRSSTSMENLKNIKNLHLFVNKNRISLITNEPPIFAIGDLDTIMHIHERGIMRPVILLNQSMNSSLFTKKLLKNQELFIDIKNPSLTLTAEQLSKKYSIDILGAVWNDDKTFANCEPYKMTYIISGGDLFTSGRCVISTLSGGTVNVPINLSKGEYEVLLKAVNITGTSTLKLITSTSSITIPVSTDKKLKWLDVGEYNINKTERQMQIQVIANNPLAIDYLLFIPKKIWNEKVNASIQILNSMQKVTYLDLHNKFPTLNIYKDNSTELSFSPTKYITYRFSWGKWWTSNTPSVKFISDGYGMTFIALNKPITSIMYFPDKIYRICIIVSIFVVILLVGYIAWYIYKRNRFQRLNRENIDEIT